MKRLTALLGVFALVCGLGFVCAPKAEAAIEIKIAGMKPEGEPETISMHKFGEHLEKLSNGKYKVKVFPNSILGKEDSYIAQTRKGIIQMCATGTQTSALHPAMAMLETPMLFDSYAHARRAMDGGKTFQLKMIWLSVSTDASSPTEINKAAMKKKTRMDPKVPASTEPPQAVTTII